MPLVSQANLNAIHGKRITIFPKDIQVWQLYRTATRCRFFVAREGSLHCAAACSAHPRGEVLKPRRLHFLLNTL
jgi:hypothetical protein